ncbi:MAG: RluA family pseudouridine synthase [Deltaproteobacteria bacterium]|nr:RluA family pseudouridine synthase [Candidatus Tharpella sp.]
MAVEELFEFVFLGSERCRLDQFLAARQPDISRSRLQVLVRSASVLVNGDSAKTSCLLKHGDCVTLKIPPPVPLQLEAQDLPLEIVYEDRHLVVVNKAAGMVVHPAAGNPDRTLVNALLFHCGDLAGIGGVMRPGIVHRLDQDTSGLLVVAKDDLSHQGLAEQFKQHTIKREYVALVYGRLLPTCGSFQSSIGRHPRQRKKMASVERGGKSARTNYQVLRYYLSGVCSWLSLRLETGRTHQIRVHASEAGHPLVGDRVYGKKGISRLQAAAGGADLLADFPRQALHARRLGFRHPVSEQYLEFESSLPLDLDRLLEALCELEKRV